MLPPLNIFSYRFLCVFLIHLWTCRQVSKVLMCDLPRCKAFDNLKRLKLGEWFLRDGCYPLLFLLRYSPHIEKLRLQLTKARFNSSPLPHCCFWSRLEFNGFLFYSCYQLGAEEYEKFPTAAAAIDPPCKEAARTFHCEKLTEIEIVYPQGDKRVHIIVRILIANISPLPEIKIKPCPNSRLSWYVS